MARLRSTAEQFRVAMQGTLDETHRILVETAKREHRRVMETDPRPQSFVRFVDGVRGAAEEAVKPAGVIVYRYPRLDQVAQFAMETLFDLSPVLSGDYRNSHTLFVGGAAVPNLKSWNTGDEIMISNTVPYSRKIEVGAMKMRVPGSDRVYWQARKIVAGRYGNIARVEFTYRGIVGAAAVAGRAGNKADLRYPVLIIRER